VQELTFQEAETIALSEAVLKQCFQILFDSDTDDTISSSTVEVT
jgi:hypothetical protein